MRTIVFFFVVLGTMLNSVHASVISDVQKVQAPINAPISLPSGLSEKGVISDIISEIFSNGGQIKNQYVDGFSNIDGRYQNTIPKWNGQNFVEGSLEYSGNRLTLDGDINMSGDIYKNGALLEDSDFLPTPPNCQGTNLSLGWNGTSWSCNTVAGTPPSSPLGTWNTGNWGTCSVTCGGGVQTRSVNCSSSSGCSGSRPSSSRSCNTGTCALPPGTWSTGSWGSCSASCGGGVQTRSVSCSSSSGCTGSRPSSSRSCNTQVCSSPTGPWTTGSWSSCSVSCGSGVQTRSVTCNYSGGCTGSRPRSSRTCNTQSCPLPTGPWTVGRWSSCSASPSWGSWSSCSNTCGTGTQTRSCRNRGGVQTRNVTCNYAGGCTGAKPSESRSCTRSCRGSSSRSCSATSSCPRWHQSTGQHCSTYCSSIGKTSMIDPASGGSCVSGENALPNVGVSYIHGVWGGYKTRIDGAVTVQTYRTCRWIKGFNECEGRDAHLCFRPGQKRDGDITDDVVGCFCG